MSKKQHRELQKRIALVADGQVKIPDFKAGNQLKLPEFLAGLLPGLSLSFPDVFGSILNPFPIPSVGLSAGNRDILIKLLMQVVEQPDKIPETIRYIDSLVHEDDTEVSSKESRDIGGSSDLINIKDKVSRDLASRWPTNQDGNPKTYISVRELASLLEVSKDTIYRKMDAGTLKGEKFGSNKGKTLFTVKHVQRMTGVHP
ncbi:excisionase family DNA-binding protein [bacterium]|nr:excisionase family DNA-binding protein [bacterium]